MVKEDGTRALINVGDLVANQCSGGVEGGALPNDDGDDIRQFKHQMLAPERNVTQTLTFEPNANYCLLTFGCNVSSGNSQGLIFLFERQAAPLLGPIHTECACATHANGTY